MNTPLPKLDCHVIEPTGVTKTVVICLRGLGASAHDFDAIIPYLHAKPSISNTKFIFFHKRLVDLSRSMAAM